MQAVNIDQAVAYALPSRGPESWSRRARVARVEALLLRAAHETLDNAGFTQVVAPTLTSLVGACGDPGTLVPVSLEGRQQYLRQTSQLHLEPLMRELGRVYSVGQSFRAERRTDDRHLTEFTLIEGEAVGMSLGEMMGLMERLVKEMLRQAANRAGDHIKALGSEPGAVERPFARMTYDEAIIALQGAGYFIEWGEDFSNSQELALAEIAGGPLFVTHYPVEMRFFTMKVCRQDPRVVECCDLLLPGVGEVMGGSVTEPDLRLLEGRLQGSRSVRQIEDLGGSADDYGWYIKVRHSLTEQQAGFGMGFERLARYCCGLPSVREAIVVGY